MNNEVAAVVAGTMHDLACNLPNMTDISKGHGNDVYTIFAHLQSGAIRGKQGYYSNNG